jgi:hypothetical protein
LRLVLGKSSVSNDFLPKRGAVGADDGHHLGNDLKVWIENRKELARDHGGVIVVKQHGGNARTKQACAEIIGEVNHESLA